MFQRKLQNKGFTAEEASKIAANTRASMDGQVGVDPGFKGWLDKKSAGFQDQLLGDTAGRLWREGKLSLSDLTNQNNRPLSPTELIAKANRLSRPPFR